MYLNVGASPRKWGLVKQEREGNQERVYYINEQVINMDSWSKGLLGNSGNCAERMLRAISFKE